MSYPSCSATAKPGTSGLEPNHVKRRGLSNSWMAPLRPISRAPAESRIHFPQYGFLWAIVAKIRVY